MSAATAKSRCSDRVPGAEPGRLVVAPRSPADLKRCLLRLKPLVLWVDLCLAFARRRAPISARMSMRLRRRGSRPRRGRTAGGVCDARAVPVLRAFLEQRLFRVKADDRLVIAEKTGKVYALQDPLTLAALGQAGRRTSRSGSTISCAEWCAAPWASCWPRSASGWRRRTRFQTRTGDWCPSWKPRWPPRPTRSPTGWSALAATRLTARKIPSSRCRPGRAARLPDPDVRR